MGIINILKKNDSHLSKSSICPNKWFNHFCKLNAVEDEKANLAFNSMLQNLITPGSNSILDDPIKLQK